MSTHRARFFIGKRLYILQYLYGEYGLMWTFTWFPYLQVWRGLLGETAMGRYVTDDYGNLVRTVPGASLH